MPNSGVVIQNLNVFRAELRAAQARYPREITVALKKAGVPVLAKASAAVPHVSGTLAGSYTTRVRGTKADVISKAPYGGGAEWGQNGKWAGWVRKHGGPPRFVWPAVESSEEQIQLIIYAELRNIIEANGWFH